MKNMKLAATKERRHGGRTSVEDYLALGYVPMGDNAHSVSLTLAYAFDDSVISTLAGDLGLQTDKTIFYNRSQAAFKLLWSANAKLMCPRTREGVLKCPSAREAKNAISIREGLH